MSHAPGFRRPWGRASFALLVGLVAVARLAHAGYTLVDLGGLPGGSGALAVDADGTIAGFQLLGPFDPHATLFANGRAVDLGTLGGDASLGLGVTDGGRVVGWARLPDSTRHAFLYDGGVMRDLGTLGGSNSQAFAINHSGSVVGSSWLADNGVEVPMMWTAQGGMVALPVPQLHGGQALGINGTNEVVGYLIDSLGVRAFRYLDGVVRVLPTLGGGASKAYGVSENGLVVGYSLTPDPVSPKFHAVFWRDTVLIDLGAMAGGHGSALAINDAGTVVGFSYDFSYPAGLEQIAVLYSTDGNRDLNSVLPADSRWHLSNATGVTQDGVISGLGVLDGTVRAYALVPDEVGGGRWGLPTGASMRSWPQPMRDAGTIEMDLPRAASGPLQLFDLTGRRLADIAGGPFPRGRVTLAVTGDVLGRLRSGVYFARLGSGADVITRRIVVVR